MSLAEPPGYYSSRGGGGGAEGISQIMSVMMLNQLRKEQLAENQRKAAYSTGQEAISLATGVAPADLAEISPMFPQTWDKVLSGTVRTPQEASIFARGEAEQVRGRQAANIKSVLDAQNLPPEARAEIEGFVGGRILTQKQLDEIMNKALGRTKDVRAAGKEAQLGPLDVRAKTAEVTQKEGAAPSIITQEALKVPQIIAGTKLEDTRRKEIELEESRKAQQFPLQQKKLQVETAEAESKLRKMRSEEERAKSAGELIQQASAARNAGDMLTATRLERQAAMLSGVTNPQVLAMMDERDIHTIVSLTEELGRREKALNESMASGNEQNVRAETEALNMIRFQKAMKTGVNFVSFVGYKAKVGLLGSTTYTSMETPPFRLDLAQRLISGQVTPDSPENISTLIMYEYPSRAGNPQAMIEAIDFYLSPDPQNDGLRRATAELIREAAAKRAGTSIPSGADINLQPLPKIQEYQDQIGAYPTP